MNSQETRSPISSRSVWHRHIRGRLFIALSLLLFCASVQADRITLNLNDADISALIKTVSEHTGRNFVVDPRVKGKVTVISAHPMDKDEFYQVFLSILEVHGFSTVPAGEVIKIVPDVKAKQIGIPTGIDSHELPGDQMVTRILQVKNVTASQLVPILRPLIPQQGHLAAYPATNVLIISDRRQNVDRLLKIISRIDQVSDSSIEVVSLRHASAAEVVRIITGLRKNKGKGAAEPAKLIADERTNSVLISGDATTRLRTRVVIEHLDTPFENEGNARVIYLRYANAKELATVLTGVSDTLDKSRKKGKGGAPSIPVNIQADEASNALIITAPQNIFNTLQSIIRKLDIRRAQVLVEAIIAEISFDRVKELGVQWIVDGTPGGSGPAGVINLGTPSIGSIAGAIAADTIPAISSGTTIGIGSFNNNSINFAALIRALETDTSSNILSTPSILTLDNQEAEIVVGQNVPFLTGQYASTGSTTTVNPFQTIQRQDVGLTLRVTPQINEGNAIQLKISQEVSSVNKTASTGAADIVTNKRTIKTVVMVDDGDTIVLGGLIDENLQQVEEKVPFLGDIPILGVLFRANSTIKVKRNLVVFLRPVIIRDAATHAAVTGEKYNFFRAQQLDMRQQGVDLLPDEAAPLLPDRFNALPQPFDEESGTSQH
ncbi:type II secretion system protein GspD [bacterium endosymbiont of Escarpia laminata]|nr:MAG: type II secretion system protein GspD [bacterium endosymbiont of Escarpia laminata]